MRYQLAVTVSTHRLDCLYTHGSQDHWTKCKKIYCDRYWVLSFQNLKNVQNFICRGTGYTCLWCVQWWAIFCH